MIQLLHVSTYLITSIRLQETSEKQEMRGYLQINYVL